MARPPGSQPGGRRHLLRPWAGVAQGQRRPCQARPAEGDVGDRDLNKVALSVAYGAGLRVSEVANLKVSDIESGRMTLRVEQGKGRRARYVMLSPQLLELLREWWRAGRPQA